MLQFFSGNLEMVALVFNDLAQLMYAMPQKAHLVGAPDKRVSAALAAGFSGLDDLLGIHADHQTTRERARPTPMAVASNRSRARFFICPPQ